MSTEDVSVSLDAKRAHDAQPKVSPDGSEALDGAAGTVQKTATMFRVPFDSEVAFGRARPPVETRKRAKSTDVGRARARGAAAELTARLHGAVAAASTPLRDGGTRLDEAAFAPYADFLAGAGLDGVLAFGTNGEAVLLSVEERRRGLEPWLELGGRILVAAHCGAQTTADTVASPLTAASGADACSSSTLRRRGPIWWPLRPPARPCRSTSTSSPRIRARPVDARAATGGGGERHGHEGLRLAVGCVRAVPARRLDIFVGPEALIHRGREAGAVGAVSALASAFPEEVAAVVREPTEDGAARLGELRSRIESFPRHAALSASWAGKRPAPAGRARPAP